MLIDKITSFFFFFLKEDKVAFNEKKQKKNQKTNGYLKIFIHHYKNMFHILKKNHKHEHI